MKQLDADKLSRAAFADGPRLLADIGATHARFALQTAPGEYQPCACCNAMTTRASCRCCAAICGSSGHAPEPCALALANPVTATFIRMTNRDWQFSTDEVRRELGLHTLLIVNDFTALAMAIPGLQAG
jgi:glucokinase